MSIELATVEKEKVLAVLGFNPRDPMTQAVMLVAEKYGLDPLLKHIQIIKGSPYVTRDGYLHVAHQSGAFDGLEVVEEKETADYCYAKVAVYRKDMSRPFQASGRASKSEKGVAPPHDMALARAERRALKRAFDVAGLPDDGGDYEEIPELVDGVDTATGEIMPAKTAEAATDLPVASVETGREGPASTAALPPDLPPVPGDDITEVLADEFDRASLQTRIDRLQLEFRTEAARDWAAERLPKVAELKTAAEYNAADELLARIETQQKQGLLARRLEVLNALETIHIAKDADKKRHAFIDAVTNGETNSAKALTSQQRDVILEEVRKLVEAEERLS